MIKVMQDEKLAALELVRLNNGADFDPKTGRHTFEPGFYVVDESPGDPVQVLEGPFLDRAYAIHRAVKRYGMPDPLQADLLPADDATTEQDELPW